MRDSVLNVMMALVVVLTPCSARAYRTAGELPEIDGEPFVGWALDSGAVVIPYELGRVVDDIRAASFDTAVSASLARWSQAGCAPVVAVSGGSTTSGPASGDGRNTISFELDSWDGFPADALAHTEVIYEWHPLRAGWAIVEADIVLNGVDHRWSLTGAPGRVSLELTLAHEAGHLLGLLHPCEVEAGALQCTPSDPISALMHPSYLSIASAAPQQDDVAGLCSLYPGSTQTGCVGSVSCGDGTCAPTRDQCPMTGSSGEAPFGHPCDFGDQCDGRVCLEDAGGTYCSQPCSSAADCPDATSCADVGTGRACVFTSAGCTAGPTASNQPVLPALMVLALMFYRRFGYR